MMKAFLIINNFAHDLFTGMWTSTVLVIYLLHERAKEQTQIAAELQDIITLFFWIGIFSTAVVFLTGGIRYRYYRPDGAGSEQVKKSLLIFKHALFIVIFSAGTFLAYRWAFH